MSDNNFAVCHRREIVLMPLRAEFESECKSNSMCFDFEKHTRSEQNRSQNVSRLPNTQYFVYCASEMSVTLLQTRLTL